ncbi:hypothetical protein CO669_25470 [Bradyrhizobium sp. Y36]|uniref:hypothetical protein n=1 Tax=Bradyrhizobium sp. Y36 TaxID=2035447 RepID=UPI000BE84CAC|nr:hypothetical protein [Bradyrhizobium sp. Y36]PDT87513.1 hypothetical protein CO669_25470 [Bradyrhizobium sp. Y36]
MFGDLEERINGIAAMIAADHYNVAQEPAFTSRLAQEIESELRRHPINKAGLRLEVATQDLGDRGPGALEKRVGADLYISLARRDRRPPVSKGMLMQAKWDITANDRKLGSQMQEMMARSEDAYVWFYGPTEIQCAKASDLMQNHVPFRSLTVGEMIVNGLRCSAGDVGIGRDLTLSRADGMRAQLAALRTPQGLSFAVVRNTK